MRGLAMTRLETFIDAAFAFALTLLGHTRVAVYDGSLDEWSRDPDLPMETGE